MSALYRYMNSAQHIVDAKLNDTRWYSSPLAKFLKEHETGESKISQPPAVAQTGYLKMRVWTWAVAEKKQKFGTEIFLRGKIRKT